MNFIGVAVLSGTSLTLLGSTVLDAQELSCGAQVSHCLPQGDLGASGFLDHRPGGGLGLQLGIAFPGGQVIVPRADLAEFRNAGKGDAKARIYQVGVDYDWYPFTRRAWEGTYLGLGVGYGFTHYQQDAASGRRSETPSNVTYALAAGCRFTRHLGAELRYTYIEFTPSFTGADSSTAAPIANASLVFRF
jgi:hypothetical protein